MNYKVFKVLLASEFIVFLYMCYKLVNTSLIWPLAFMFIISLTTNFV